MSVDLLRRAAGRLREHAEGATPGPWDHVDHGSGPDNTFMGCGQVVSVDPEAYGCDVAGPTGDLYPRGPYSPREAMAYIALMHPPVALAMAAWLEFEAAHGADVEDVLGLEVPAEIVAVARAILREDPS